MRQILDFLPIVLLAVGYWKFDLYVGTGLFMAATCVQMAVIYALDRRLETIQKYTLGFALVFGGLTVGLHDERFLRWLSPIFYIGIAIALAYGFWIKKKNYLQMMLGAQIPLPESIWKKLIISWIAFSLFMAMIKAYAAIYLSTGDWVLFKIWGYVFPVGFLIYQMFIIYPHLQQAEDNENSEAPKP